MLAAPHFPQPARKRMPLRISHSAAPPVPLRAVRGWDCASASSCSLYRAREPLARKWKSGVWVQPALRFPVRRAVLHGSSLSRTSSSPLPFRALYRLTCLLFAAMCLTAERGHAPMPICAKIDRPRTCIRRMRRRLYFSLGVESSRALERGPLRILSLPTGQELAPWHPPGCCGFLGPVPSATLDKRRREATRKS